MKKIDFVKMFIVEELLYYISKLVMIELCVEVEDKGVDDWFLQVLQLKCG